MCNPLVGSGKGDRGSVEACGGAGRRDLAGVDRSGVFQGYSLPKLARSVARGPSAECGGEREGVGRVGHGAGRVRAGPRGPCGGKRAWAAFDWADREGRAG